MVQRGKWSAGCKSKWGGPRGEFLSSLCFICFVLLIPGTWCSPQECGRISDRPNHGGHQTDRTTGGTTADGSREKAVKVIFFFQDTTLEEKEASAGASLFISTTITTIYTILVQSVLSIIVQSVLSIFHHHLWQGIKAKIAVGSVVAGKNLMKKAMGCPSGRKHTRCLSLPKQSQRNAEPQFCDPGQKTNCQARNPMNHFSFLA